MQIYGLPQGNVADVGGAIEGGTNFKQRQELFKQAQRDLAAQRKQEQQQAKFKKLYAGVKAAEQSPGVLNVLARDFPEYAPQAQELLQLAQTNPQGYQAKIRELQGIIGMQAGIEPQQKHDDRTSQQSDFEYYQRLTPDERGVWDHVKRAQPQIKLVDIPLSDGRSIKGIFDPNTQRIFTLDGRPVTELGQRGDGQATDNPPATVGVSQSPAQQAAETERAKADVQQEIKADAKSVEAQQILESALQLQPVIAKSGGTWEGIAPPITGERVDARAIRSNIVSKLQLGEREKMKGTGQISDFESKLLGDAATILGNYRISDELAEKELKKVIDVFKGKYRDLPIVKTDEDYESLPPGTLFSDEKGNLFRKD